MKRHTLPMLLVALTGCGRYTMSTFYVKNPSDKPVRFNAAVVKYSSVGPHLLNVPFTVPPRDSVLARRVALRNDLGPENWFETFEILPTGGLQFNDPKQSQNWVKTTGKDGKPVYTFTLTR